MTRKHSSTMSHVRSRLSRVIVGLAAAAAGIIGVTALAAPQSASAAGTPGCVSRIEYGQARKGMSPTRVANLFGTTGKVTGSGNIGGYKFVNRQYRTCTSQYGFVSVDFFNDGPRTPVVLDSKFVIW
jgi:hypothetical protein